MTVRALLVGLLLIGSASTSAQPVPTVTLRPGLVITRSVRVRPGTYRLPAPASLDSALVTVRGDDVTVDLRGVRLIGLPEEADPDRARGVAVRVDGGRNITVSGATIRGYRVAILVRGTRNLTLADNDVSYNWKPRLFSGAQHESLVDWLSYHQNERDEWLRFGAGIYLRDVRGGELRGNRGAQGMNALLMTRTDSLLVWNNTFSFNSGLGIGMYRSSGNRILHNRVDFDVRGYSHGFFARGQDSAALLMFEQCAENVVAFNSMTHGGDGLFLWAGQHTMDTGDGGSNDNLFYGNDFSWAPTNGMEATFSRNTFVANRVVGSEHGLWGGYSFQSRIVSNAFARNRVAIAVEHGQDNAVAYNSFEFDSTAIRLWANPIEPSDWGYPKRRDTRSRDWLIANNTFAINRVGVRAEQTTGITARDNEVCGVDSATVTKDSTRVAVVRSALGQCGLALREVVIPDSIRRLLPAPLPNGFEPNTSPWALHDRSTIVVDAWGPYDWRSPKLWPIDSVHGPTVRLRVLGPLGAQVARQLGAATVPLGSWRVVRQRGVAALSRSSGTVPDTIAVTVDDAARGDWSLTLEYRGLATVSPRGTRTAAGVPVRFTYEHFAPPVAWTARWHVWGADTLRTPLRDAAALNALLAGTPRLEQRLPRLDFYGVGAPAPGLPRERVALEATGRLVLPSGSHTLRLVSADAARVWVDGRLAIDAWAPHESRVDYAAVGGGAHDVRVVYLQTGGWTELRLDALRGVAARSSGSPGPH